MGKMTSVGFKPAMTMIWGYIKSKLLEQVKAVAFIILYLIGFKMIALQSFPENPWQIALGVLLVIVGLALFLEGLMLGLMPLGDKVGIRLPQKTNILVIMIFGLLLGFGATLAEPAISTLRQAGENVTPWETPLLYRFLEIETDSLVNAVGAGVGVAVACGMARFYYGFGLKWFIYILTPVLLIMSGWFATDENLKYIINLAWDTGGVTTGPVTVPLVLAMGIGISRAGSKNKGAAASGYGVVTLASLFPVLGVFVLGLMMNPSTPSPVTQEKFFSPEYRQEALKMMKTENALEAWGYTQEEKEQQERERINHLSLTKREVFLAIYKDKQITPDMIRSMLTTEEAKIEFDYANDYFRGNPLIEQLGQSLGYSTNELDSLFINKSFSESEEQNV